MFTANKEQKYDLIISVASGLIAFEEIVSWVEIHTSK
jgi:hypothetical protein